MNRIILAIITTALTTGCATVWDKDGATQADFNKDEYRCQRESATGVMYTASYGIVQGRATQDRRLYMLCMQAAGYTVHQ